MAVRLGVRRDNLVQEAWACRRLGWDFEKVDPEMARRLVRLAAELDQLAADVYWLARTGR